MRHSTEGQTRRLLLPLSFGVSSNSLLHILSEHIDNQARKSRRAGYALHVLHVVSDETPTPPDPLLKSMQERYPRHTYSQLRFNPAEVAAINPSDAPESRPPDLGHLIASITSPTSKKDIELVSMRRAVVDEARRLGCEAVLWGDTTTSLAEKILAETAKGRGYTLPWLTNDGESPLGLPFFFPMRDLLRKELPPFLDAVGFPSDLVSGEGRGGLASAPASTRNATIDGLMKEYFQSVEENFPSIVANVVRTSSKLQAGSAGSSARTTACSLCAMPYDANIADDANEQQLELDDREESQAVGSGPAQFCYGCRQSMQTRIS